MSAESEGGPRRALPEAVAEQLRTDILRGKFRPGDRLPTERELAVQLQVNRSSVREALKKLEQLRLVRIQQGSGIRVLAPEQASFDLVWNLLFQGGKAHRVWLEDLLELRDGLVLWVLQLALDRATDEQLAACAELLTGAADPGLTDEAFAELTRHFQQSIARMSGNRVLLLLANTVSGCIAEPRFAPLRREVARARGALAPLLAQIATPLRARDHEAAARVVRELLAELRGAILRASDESVASDAAPSEAADSES
jgi:GntR family transcriptional regulator, transcriptional repressor for pyruvate dehydrogenase complex